MAQSKVTKKSGRHSRNKHSEHAPNPAAPQDEVLAQDAPAGCSGAHATDASELVLLPAVRSNASAHDDHRSMPLAVISPHLPAELGSAQPATPHTTGTTGRRRRTIMQSLLIGGSLTAALIFSLGTFKTQRSDTEALAGPAAVATASAAAANASTGNTTPSAIVENGIAVPRAPRARHKASAQARAEKKLVHAQDEHPAPAVAGHAKKKPASAVAKVQKKKPDSHPVPLLAQNSAALATQSTWAQDSYAQCRDLGSFFRREQCKWRVCSGKWGQDGCPAYSSENREIN